MFKKWRTIRVAVNVISAAEAAKISGLHIQTIREYCKTGRLPARRFGNSYVIDPSALERLLVDPPRRGRPRKHARRNAP